jgi:hypothetical protein
MFDITKHKLNTHRVSGGFHWELKVNGFKYGSSFVPILVPALTDTGTSSIWAPQFVWDAIFKTVCLDLPAGMSCTSTETVKQITSCLSSKFGKILVKIDSTLYPIKFSDLFSSSSLKQTCTTRNRIDETRLVLGVPFLDQYY